MNGKELMSKLFEWTPLTAEKSNDGPVYGSDDKEIKKSEDVTFDEEENTVLNGEVIDNKNAPAPIKNDEKSSYKNKKQ